MDIYLAGRPVAVALEVGHPGESVSTSCPWLPERPKLQRKCTKTAPKETNKCEITRVLTSNNTSNHFLDHFRPFGDFLEKSKIFDFFRKFYFFDFFKKFFRLEKIFVFQKKYHVASEFSKDSKNRT